MELKKLAARQRKEAASLLAGYWKERGMGEYGQGWAEDYLAQGHKKEIAKDEFFALEENGRMAGIVSLITEVSGLVQIRDLVVKPGFRGKGYGRRILEEAVEIALKRKARKVFALTFPEHERLFLSLGFEREGLLRNHFRKGEDMVVMGRTLL